jgi:hypothetical protein
VRTRGILPTNRPDDIPLVDWETLLHGQSEALDRAVARLWLSLPLVRRSRRLGIGTRRMLVLYALVNLWAIAVIEAVITVLGRA